MLFPIAAQRADVQYVWRGPSVLIASADGRVGGHAMSGFYFRQTRYLKDLSLTLDGQRPYPCSVAEVSANRLEASFIHPEVARGDGGGSGSGGELSPSGIPYRAVDVRVTYDLRAASLTLTLCLTNRSLAAVTVELALEAAADFATLDEVQFDEVPDTDVVVQADDTLRFACQRGGSPLRAVIEPLTDGFSIGPDALRTALTLRPQEPRRVSIRVAAVDAADPIDAEGERQREERLCEWTRHVTRMQAPSESRATVFAARGLQDIGALSLLEGPADEWLTPAAGAPLYLSLWGRDALTVSWQAALFDRARMAADVLRCLGRLQGTRHDSERDELPGRIINQAKRDPVSRGGGTPFARAYQDVASPFMYIITLGYHHALNGDRDFIRHHWERALNVLAWAEQHGDLDGDGYIEYLTRSPTGPRHQGWKDSENAIVREDGSQVAPPFASCEIQGYWYAALQFMAVLSFMLGEKTRAAELWHRAGELKARFNRDFWVESEGCIAFGLDADKRAVAVATSNAAQCLTTGIVDREHTARLVRRIFEPDLFSGWGIRTLSTRNPAYNPLDYHLGSVWPVENATVLFGLRRYGFNEQTLRLAQALYDLACLWPAGRTPECVGGYARDEFQHPGAYPRANRPQAWNQSVWPLLLQSLLGIVPYAPLRVLLVDPLLPAWLPEITLRDLRLGDAAVDLRFWREADGSSHYAVLEKRGRIRIVRQSWFESYTSSWSRRLKDLFRSMKS